MMSVNICSGCADGLRFVAFGKGETYGRRGTGFSGILSLEKNQEDFFRSFVGVTTLWIALVVPTLGALVGSWTFSVSTVVSFTGDTRGSAVIKNGLLSVGWLFIGVICTTFYELVQK